MEIYFYSCSSEKERLVKSLENETMFEGNFRNEVNVINPILQIATDSMDLYTILNYAYILDLNRYYFIDRVESYRTGVITVYLSIDVLYSYADAIKELQAIVTNDTSNPYYSGNVQGHDTRKTYESKTLENNFNETGVYVLCAVNSNAI